MDGKKAPSRYAREWHPADSVVDCSGVRIGGGGFHVIAGPCCVESEQQIVSIAKAVQAAGATLLRGGAFKPRTSPYSFRGLGEAGLEMLLAARRETGLPVVSELTSIEKLPLYNDVDVIQVGARNMQNFDLLQELGENTRKPILLKRGLSATIEELLMSAEYILSAGNPNVILCERGVRSFETSTRNMVDLGAVPMLKRLSHLPVMVDPSHACGLDWMVEPLAIGATAMGADGLMIEVHDNPEKALCDGRQSQTVEMFARTMEKVRGIRRLAWSPGRDRSV